VKKSKVKILLLDVGILFLDILSGILIFILVIITFPFWIFLVLGDILCEMYANCRASLDYEIAMKEIRRREVKE